MMITMSGARSLGMTMVGGLMMAGCSTSSTFVHYGDHGMYSTETVGNVPYVEIGPVTASQRGNVWNSCEDLANQAAERLHQQGESRGATHVIDVRWLDHADGGFSEQPICTTGWGWFAAAGVGGFMPWVKVSEAHGSLATVELDGLAAAEALGEERIREYRDARREEVRARAAAEEAAAEESVEHNDANGSDDSDVAADDAAIPGQF